MMSRSILVQMQTRKKQQLHEEYAQMNEIEQMLRVIYVSLWGQAQYERVVMRYKQRELRQNLGEGQFNVQGKLLEDIVEGINNLKEENRELRRCSVAANNRQKLSTKANNINSNNINKPITTSTFDFTKKSSTTSTTDTTTSSSSNNYYINQLKTKQTLIVKLQNKIVKLEDRICKLQSELMEYKEQSVNLHRLNESKYSKISELRKQIEEQEELIEEQGSVIEELERTINQTIIQNSSSQTCSGTQQRNNNRVLEGLQLQQKQQNNSQQRQQLIQEGRISAWRQLMEQLQQSIQAISKPTLYKHQQDNNGIQQLQLSFNQFNQTSLNNTYHHHLQQQQQISQIIHHHHEFQVEQNSQIHNLLGNFNNTNYIEHQQSSIIDEPSFLSNTTNNRYLQTIQTMTQQLTQAYNRINILQSHINANETNKHDQKLFSTTATLNPQSITPTPLEYIEKSKKNKNKSFNFNLSFWK